MRLLYVALFSLTLGFASFEYKGSVTTFYQQNIQVKANKDPFISDVRTQIETKYINENKDLKALFDAEVLYDLKDDKRRFFYVKQASLEYIAEDYSIAAGELILNWAKLEGYSPMDIYNVTNIVKDPLTQTKLGSLGLSFTYYLENAQLRFTARLLETIQEFPYTRSVYYIFADTTRFSDLSPSLNLLRPTLFLRYTSTLESDDLSLDYGVMFSNGYDPLRGVTLSSFDVATNSLTYQPVLFNSSKLMAYMSLPLDALIVKSEMGITYSEDSSVAHYAQLGLGLEYSTTSWFDSSVVYLMEYHRMIQSRTTNTLNDRDFFYLFQNDMILGARYAFNDVFNSSLLLGTIIDLEYLEASVQLQYDSKLSDTIGFTIKAVKVLPTQRNETYSTLGTTIQTYNTIYRSLGEFTSLSILLNYTY